MPYYKSATGKTVVIKIGKSKTELKIEPNPQFYKQENLELLFPNHIIKIEEEPPKPEKKSEVQPSPIPLQIKDLDDFIRQEVTRQNPQPFKEVYLKETLPTGSWKGQRCFIIGGGPSLKDFDFSKLQGEKIIAINKAFVDVPFAQIQLSVDERFQKWILNPKEVDDKGMEDAKRLWPDFKGHKVWVKIPGQIYQNGIEFVHLAGSEGISTSLEEGVFASTNSGYAAINLAIALGANPIYLLGYDMKHGKNGETHYHSGYSSQQTERQLHSFAKKFPKLAKMAEEKNIKIINLNKNSALQCFEFGDIEKILTTPIIPVLKNYIIVSFYTPEYINDITQLIKSAEQFNLPYDFQLLKNLPLRGSNKYKNWSKNAYQKAEFIKRMMEKYPEKDIVWVDADAIIQQYPYLFDHLTDYDIGVHYRDNEELLTGTIYIHNNEVMKEIVDKWISVNKTSRNFLEQKNLEIILKENKQVKAYNLPPTYCQIFDTMKKKGSPVIEHFQSSRKWRLDKEKKKKISIIMPTYNQGKFIQESINSVLNQTFENFELIIVNDGSTDNTKEILSTQSDPRIKIIHKENEGTGSALNTGFKEAIGEYETWLASDNKYYPTALKDMFNILEREHNIDFVYCNCEIGTMDNTGLVEIERKNYNLEVSMEWDAHKFYERYNIGIVWLWRKELRISAGKDFITEPCEDYEMTTRMIEAGGKFYYHPIVSGWHRRHNKNTTKIISNKEYRQKLKNKLLKKRTELENKNLPKSEHIPEPKKWYLEKIPKIAYFYWGADKLPWLRYLTIYSFIKMNPDWEVILYYPIEITKINTWNSTEQCYEINCPDYFEELKKLPIAMKEFDGQNIGIRNEYPEVWKSDFLRWHLLSHYGGVWLDMDIFFNKSMNYINLNIEKNKNLDTIVSISNILPGSFHSIGFMGSGPNNDYYRYVMSKAIKTKPDFTNYQSIGVVLLNKEFPTINSIQEKFPNIKVDSIEFDTVYAYYPMKYITDIFSPDAPNRLKPHSIGIHWYAGHPAAGEFLNKVTPKNYKNFASTPLGKLFMEVLG